MNRFLVFTVRGKSPDRPCDRDLRISGKAREGGDAVASAATSNAARARNTAYQDFYRGLLSLLVLTSIAWPGCSPDPAPPPSDYEDLLQLFDNWKQFLTPPQVNGAGDYSPQAMSNQFQTLGDFQRRLAAIDPSPWPVSQQVDYALMQAQMNGMQFEHRILRPWQRNPAFYLTVHPSRSDVPEHEGPNAHPAVDLWKYDYPLNLDSAAALEAQIRTVPVLLVQARGNLTGNARDLWKGGIHAMDTQLAALDSLRSRVAGHASLSAAIEAAEKETRAFQQWLQAELPSKTGASGVGKENYTWNLQNVHLVPYTWEEEMTLMQRELARAHASLRLAEHRNRNLPVLEPVDGPEEYDRRFNESVDEYIRFMHDQEVMTVKDYMDEALRERLGSFSEGPRGFFGEVMYRDPLVFRAHMHHWIELAQQDREPHPNPIRRDPLPYNIFDGRSEGLATGMEEMMLHAGMYDGRPRAEELVWIMLAQRAARAIAGLRLHSNEYTIEEATEFAARWTPRNWMPADSDTALFEQHFYLQQPGYGTSYLVGKIKIEQLIAERALQMGGDFTLKRFMDEFRAAGLIPVSLIRRELTEARD